MVTVIENSSIHQKNKKKQKKQKKRAGAEEHRLMVQFQHSLSIHLWKTCNFKTIMKKIM